MTDLERFKLSKAKRVRNRMIKRSLYEAQSTLKWVKHVKRAARLRIPVTHPKPNHQQFKKKRVITRNYLQWKADKSAKSAEAAKDPKHPQHSRAADYARNATNNAKLARNAATRVTTVKATWEARKLKFKAERVKKTADMLALRKARAERRAAKTAAEKK